jgi:hypothetical protein
MKWLRALPPSVTGDIELNFIDHKGLHVQAMARAVPAVIKQRGQMESMVPSSFFR